MKLKTFMVDNKPNTRIWKYYIFFDNNRMMFFTEDFDQVGYNDQVRWDFVEEKNFSKTELSSENKKKIMREWWKTNTLFP